MRHKKRPVNPTYIGYFERLHPSVVAGVLGGDGTGKGAGMGNSMKPGGVKSTADCMRGWPLSGSSRTVDAAGGHQLGLEFRAISATATASLGELVVGIHVSTIFYVDTMLLDWRRHCQMGWPDAY